MSKPKYPEVRVNLLGQDGNAFHILGLCTRAMNQAGLSKEIQEEFRREAMSKTYDDLLITCMKWFEVE